MAALCLIILAMSSCGGKKGKSSATGWNYNDPKWGGFEVADFKGQDTGPGLVLIEGGTFVMGNTEQDVMYEYHNVPRRVTVSSFYMDETEVTNVQYREYLYWLTGVFGEDYPEIRGKATPDTLVWRDELAYNEPFVEYYFRHPAYNEYPVVGIDWHQANEYAKWRSDRVNEMYLMKKGILEHNPNQLNEDHFNTDAYLLGEYEGIVKKNLKNLDPNGPEERKVKFDDGILQPNYRLPTEAEWEYAALALAGNNVQGDESLSDRRIYPWDGSGVRFGKRTKWQGKIQANFKRGRGDNMGVAGALNDNAEITAPVKTFLPNDYGLYNMAGNVSEWVLDVYRPLTTMDAEDFNPFRGNVFQTRKKNEDGSAVFDSLGRSQYRQVTEEENINRRNYRKGYAIDYKDGDEQSGVEYGYGISTLVSDESRVIKGGNWNDRAYFLSPGTRRYLEEDQASSTVGFRCAMIRVGSPSGNNFKGGNKFKKKRGKK